MLDLMRLWAPPVALAAGALAGLGILRASRWTFWLALGLAVVQIIAWMLVSVLLTRQPGESWDVPLGAGFLLGLLFVVPYTTIGAVIVGGLLAFSFRRGGKARS